MRLPRSHEFADLDRKRSSRTRHLDRKIAAVTGAEDAFVVNNNAGALVLCVNELAQGLEVIVSRGELVEIGGSFRLPDVLSRAGAILVEVGTTNRTRRTTIGTSIPLEPSAPAE